MGMLTFVCFIFEDYRSRLNGQEAGMKNGKQTYLILTLHKRSLIKTRWLSKMLNVSKNNLNNEGSIRTVLDVGCGVASFGAYLLSFNIIAMSVAPNDMHQNQIQFSLERGIPTYLGVLEYSCNGVESDDDPDVALEVPMEACIRPYSDHLLDAEYAVSWSVYQVWGISMMHEMPHPEFENLDIISS
ncbi:hypothetical protein GIB67_038697 [Kingdonia uniflora]|uniref:Methyltransferase n=1 Tax=Kingdonia uniflora TaxID=39325 RepID=A0A7J7NT52_9MAGN|nr:hypothetical protein GIB67_038697 [Kingdonia uniflora]